jgi:hypothetical protein
MCGFFSLVCRENSSKFSSDRGSSWLVLLAQLQSSWTKFKIAQERLSLELTSVPREHPSACLPPPLAPNSSVLLLVVFCHIRIRAPALRILKLIYPPTSVLQKDWLLLLL